MFKKKKKKEPTDDLLNEMAHDNFNKRLIEIAKILNAHEMRLDSLDGDKK